MKFPTPIQISRIADLIQAKIIGNADIHAVGINEIHKVEKGDIVFVDHPKYYDKCLYSAADIIIINTETVVPEGKALLVCKEPFEAYLQIVSYFRPFISAKQLISDKATVGENTIIQPGCFIGSNVEIGSGCIIHPNVTIYDHVKIGNNVVIHAGSVIGSDAFYFNTKKNRPVWYKKMASCGNVIIEDDVEIGVLHKWQ